MKLHSKLVMLSLALIMVLALSACGNDDISGEVTNTEGQTPDNNTETSEPDEATYEMGSMNGGVYTNGFIGIGCELDENWVYYNDEQLSDLNGIAMEATNNDDVVAALENGTVIFDMYASSSDGLATINVVFENLGVVNGITMDESKYVEAALNYVKDSFESAGGTNIMTEITTIEFAGAERACISSSCEISGVTMYQKQICIKQGHYMAIITPCSFSEDITDNLAAMFYSLD